MTSIINRIITVKNEEIFRRKKYFLAITFFVKFLKVHVSTVIGFISFKFSATWY